jgi:hypothetical protein
MNKQQEKITIVPVEDIAAAEDDFSLDENKYPRSNSLRRETELFRDQDYVPYDMVSVKRIDLNSGQNWQIMLNKKPVLILTSSRFTSKERAFLSTIDGMNFIISGYKKGWKSVSEFKRQIKKHI